MDDPGAECSHPPLVHQPHHQHHLTIDTEYDDRLIDFKDELEPEPTSLATMRARMERVRHELEVQAKLNRTNRKSNFAPAVQWLHEILEAELRQMIDTGDKPTKTLRTYVFEWSLVGRDAYSNVPREMLMDPQVWKACIDQYYHSPGTSTIRVALIYNGKTALLSLAPESTCRRWWLTHMVSYHGWAHRWWRLIQSCCC
jgi:hypothetical protein